MKGKATYAPVYCAIYPELADIAKKHGYALAIHGSLQRDFDLICIPWIENPDEPSVVIEAMTSEFALNLVSDGKQKLHGRVAYTIAIAFGECAIDLSFMPMVQV